MPFFNQPSIILQDSMGNLHNFIYKDQRITYYTFHKLSNKIQKKVIVNHVTNDFDANINSLGEIYLVCKKKEGSIVLLSSHRDFTHERVIEEAKEEMYNMNITLVKNDIHVFYCRKLQSKEKVLGICHYYDDGKSYTIQEIATPQRGDILNPIQVIMEKDKILLAYYDVVAGIEQLFIKTYEIDKKRWRESLPLTASKENKLYLDMISIEEDQLHVSYCEHAQGNLVVKYEKYRKEEKGYKREINQKISNPANCQNPTLIQYGEILWLCWIEYNYVASRYSKNGGMDWSEIYLWKLTKMEDIIRYKYIATQQNTIGTLNYSFGRADNLEFVGFGNLENTKIIPFKKRGSAEMSQHECNCASDEIMDKIQKDMKKVEERIKDAESKLESRQGEQESMKSLRENTLKEMEERLLIIENFLIKNTRGFKNLKK